MRFEFPLAACLQRVLEVMEGHPRIRDSIIRVASLPPRSGYFDVVVDVDGFIKLDRGRVGIFARDVHTCITIETNYLVEAGSAFSLAEKVAAENGVKLVEADSEGHGDFCVTLPFDSTREQIRYALDKMVTAVISYMTRLQTLNLYEGGRLREDDVCIGR